MRTTRLFCLGSRLALAGVLFGSTLALNVAPQMAAAAPGESDRDPDLPWPARVNGTQGRGLLVRTGPSTDFATILTLPEGTKVQVIYGPEMDRDGRAWYIITGWDRSGRSGWSANDYLSQYDPNEPDPVPVALTVQTPPSGQTASAGQTAATGQSASATQAAGNGRSMVARVTAYSYQTPEGGAHGSITRTGTQVRWGTVAVDPTVIPLGSRLLIEGYDTVFIAEDTGGGVRGAHVDVFFPDLASAVRFGVQYRTVTILN